MSVFKRNGVGKYYIQFNYNGKTYCRSSKTTNKRTAERIEREWKDEIHLIEELGERPRIKLPHLSIFFIINEAKSLIVSFR